MLNSIILHKIDSNNLRFEKEIIETVNLEMCLTKSSGRNETLIRGLIDKTKDEKLSLINVGENNTRFNLTCEYQTSVPLAAGMKPFVPITHDIVLRNKSNYVISYNIGRKISRISTTLIGFALCDNPGTVNPISLDKNDFLNVINWITQSPLEGQIKSVSVKDTRYQNSQYRHASLSSNYLEESQLFNDLLDSTPFVASLGFETPEIRSTGRSLSCRLSHWGGLVIYSRELLDVEILELIHEIERLLA